MNSDQKKFPEIKDIDMDSWCKKLECTEEQLQFCIHRVGTSWISVEAFWVMNKDRIRKSVINK